LNIEEFVRVRIQKDMIYLHLGVVKVGLLQLAKTEVSASA